MHTSRCEAKKCSSPGWGGGWWEGALGALSQKVLMPGEISQKVLMPRGEWGQGVEGTEPKSAHAWTEPTPRSNPLWDRRKARHGKNITLDACVIRMREVTMCMGGSRYLSLELPNYKSQLHFAHALNKTASE